MGIQHGSQVVLKRFSVDEEPILCSISSDVIDFTLDPNGHLIVLGSKNDVTVFSINFARHSCIAQGRMLTKQNSKNINAIGAMLLLTNDIQSTMTAYSLTSSNPLDLFN